MPIHDWALEETISAVIMQAELLLVDRNAPATAPFIPLFNRTLALIESRRDAATGLLLAGTSSNLLAPSYGAWLHANGTRMPAFLTGMCVSYVAALDRVIELERLTGFAALAAAHAAARDRTLAALPQLIEPGGKYFVKWMDPNGTLHGVLGQARHGYIEAVVNHDAVALGVAERVKPGLAESIMAALLGDAVPVNPLGGQGLRPFGLVLTQAPGLDDMEARVRCLFPPYTSAACSSRVRPPSPPPHTHTHTYTHTRAHMHRQSTLRTTRGCGSSGLG